MGVRRVGLGLDVVLITQTRQRGPRCGCESTTDADVAEGKEGFATAPLSAIWVCGVGSRPAYMVDRGVWGARYSHPHPLTRLLPDALRREPRAPPISPFLCPIPESEGGGDCAVWWWSAVVVCSCVSGMSERRSGASVGRCM